MDGLADELDELEAELAAVEMEAGPVAVGEIKAPGTGVKQPVAAAKSKQKEEEDELAAMMAM